MSKINLNVQNFRDTNDFFSSKISKLEEIASEVKQRSQGIHYEDFPAEYQEAIKTGTKFAGELEVFAMAYSAGVASIEQMVASIDVEKQKMMLYTDDSMTKITARGVAG